MRHITIPSNRVVMSQHHGEQAIEDRGDYFLIGGPCTQYFTLEYTASKSSSFTKGETVYIKIVEVKKPNDQGLIIMPAFGNTWSAEKSRIKRGNTEIEGVFVVDTVHGGVVYMVSTGSMTSTIRI